jgi:hypothetical protein
MEHPKPPKYDRVLSLRQDGYSYALIAQLTGVPRRTLARWCLSAGLVGIATTHRRRYRNHRGEDDDGDDDNTLTLVMQEVRRFRRMGLSEKQIRKLCKLDTLEEFTRRARDAGHEIAEDESRSGCVRYLPLPHEIRAARRAIRAANLAAEADARGPAVPPEREVPTLQALLARL